MTAPTLFDATDRGRAAFLETVARGPWTRKASAVILTWIVQHPRSVEIEPDSGQFAAPRLSRADLAERAGVGRTAAHEAVAELRKAGVLAEHGEHWLLDCNRVVELVDAHGRQTLAEVARQAFGGRWSAEDALAAIAESQGEPRVTDEPDTEADRDPSPVAESDDPESPRSPVFAGVRHCSPAFAGVRSRSPVFAAVRQCSPVFTRTGTGTGTGINQENSTGKPVPVPVGTNSGEHRRTGGARAGPSPWKDLDGADLLGPRLPIAKLWAVFDYETAAGRLDGSHDAALKFWGSIFQVRQDQSVRNPVAVQFSRIRAGTLFMSADWIDQAKPIVDRRFHPTNNDQTQEQAAQLADRMAIA